MDLCYGVGEEAAGISSDNTLFLFMWFRIRYSVYERVLALKGFSFPPQSLGEMMMFVLRSLMLFVPSWRRIWRFFFKSAVLLKFFSYLEYTVYKYFLQQPSIFSLIRNPFKFWLHAVCIRCSSDFLLISVCAKIQQFPSGPVLLT